MSQENLENILLAAIGIFDINPTKGQAAEFMTAVNRILRDAAEQRNAPVTGRAPLPKDATGESGELFCKCTGSICADGACLTCGLPIQITRPK